MMIMMIYIEIQNKRGDNIEHLVCLFQSLPYCLKYVLISKHQEIEDNIKRLVEEKEELGMTNSLLEMEEKAISYAREKASIKASVIIHCRGCIFICSNIRVRIMPKKEGLEESHA